MCGVFHACWRMPVYFPSGHELIAAQNTEKAAVATKMYVQLLATDSHTIQQMQKRGAERGVKRGPKRGGAGVYPVNCSLGDEGS